MLNDKETNELIVKTEKEISKMLKELEQSTGCVVDAVFITDIDITTNGDKITQKLRRAVIEVTRLPGTQWQI